MLSSARPVLKALGDETRFSIYAWLRDRNTPATIAEVAAFFDLHPNTVRPHLDRLRDAGLVRLDATPQGGVGRPQHRYTAVPAELDLTDDGAVDLLVRMLTDLCCRLRVPVELATGVGRETGIGLVERDGQCAGPLEALAAEMARLGFGPVADGASVVFTCCPFRSLADSYPELVCAMHRGLASGVVEACGGALVEFHERDEHGRCSALVEVPSNEQREQPGGSRWQSRRPEYR